MGSPPRRPPAPPLPAGVVKSPATPRALASRRRRARDLGHGGSRSAAPRADSTTRQPSAASDRAMARPMPRLEPVITRNLSSQAEIHERYLRFYPLADKSVRPGGDVGDSLPEKSVSGIVVQGGGPQQLGGRAAQVEGQGQGAQVRAQRSDVVGDQGGDGGQQAGAVQQTRPGWRSWPPSSARCAACPAGPRRCRAGRRCRRRPRARGRSSPARAGRRAQAGLAGVEQADEAAAEQRLRAGSPAGSSSATVTAASTAPPASASATVRNCTGQGDQAHARRLPAQRPQQRRQQPDLGGVGQAQAERALAGAGVEAPPGPAPPRPAGAGGGATWRSRRSPRGVRRQARGPGGRTAARPPRGSAGAGRR